MKQLIYQNPNFSLTLNEFLLLQRIFQEDHRIVESLKNSKREINIDTFVELHNKLGYDQKSIRHDVVNFIFKLIDLNS